MADAPDAAGFAEFAQDLAEEADVEGAAQRLVDVAMDLTDAEYAGVGWQLPDRWSLLAASADLVMQVQDLEHTVHEGPIRTAMDHDETVLVADVGTETRWPEWCPRAAAMGVGSAIVACLRVEQNVQGVLMAYSSLSARMGTPDMDTTALLAQHASVVMDMLWRESAMRYVAHARNIIGQAQGVLIERYGLSSRDAFESLRRISADTGVKLRDVAVEVAATRQVPEQYLHASGRNQVEGRS